MTFRVGQRVVRVDASPAKYDSHIKLVLDRIYTVSGFDTEVSGVEIGVYLLEVPLGRVPLHYTTPRGWNARRFRPLVERKTDISIFTKMLTPHGVDA